MLLFGDYHTHTIYSRNFHGKNTIEQNVKVAVQKGLKEIGITEHGFEHRFFGVKRKNIKKMRAEIDRLQKIYPIKIYLGIEANIISYDGDIDLSQEEQKWFDYVIVGLHQCAKFKRCHKELFKNNQKMCKTKNYTTEMIEQNTKAYINAITKNRVNIISHIASKFKCNITEVAKVCKQTGTLLEINGRRICYSQDDIKELVKMGTMFIINSDAHKSKNVGECNYPTNFAVMNNIPQNLIVNMDKLPEFKYTEIKWLVLVIKQKKKQHF